MRGAAASHREQLLVDMVLAWCGGPGPSKLRRRDAGRVPGAAGLSLRCCHRCQAGRGDRDGALLPQLQPRLQGIRPPGPLPAPRLCHAATAARRGAVTEMVRFFRSCNLASRVFDRQVLSPRPGSAVSFVLLLSPFPRSVFGSCRVW
nr:unnamed protein product [Digitaria exilis]